MSPVRSISKRWIGSNILGVFFRKLMWGWVKRLGGCGVFFKKTITRTNASFWIICSSRLSNRIYFWFTSMLYFSFIPLNTDVKKNRHKYQEDGTPSPGLKVGKMHSKGQESCTPAHSPSCAEGMCTGAPYPGPSPDRSGGESAILPSWGGQNAKTDWCGLGWYWRRKHATLGSFSDYYTAIKIVPTM